MTQKVLAIVGPTAVGKTAWSIALAKRFNGEIISGDSMQVYRHLNIGTAKVTREEMANIPHHVIDCLHPSESYSASQFQTLAREKIEAIARRGKLPIIVGGTGLYIEGLLFDLDFGGENSTSADVREQLQRRLANEGAAALYDTLVQQDSIAAAQIDPNNTRRIIRALEVMQQTGIRFSEQSTQTDGKLPRYDSYIIGLTTDRERLYERINQRVDDMLANGLLEEAKWLLQQNLPADTLALQAIGYKELFPYLQQEDTLEHCVAVLKQNSRRYAKRQLTWFRNRMAVNWFDLGKTDSSEMIKEVAQWLKRSY